MPLFAILARLLDYPSAALQDSLAEIGQRVAAASSLEAEEQQAILAMLTWMASRSLLEMQSHYVDLFDMNPDHSLHLTHHLLGDDNRARGPALIHLASHFCQHGWEIGNGELPDFLPLLLEFAAQLPAQEAQNFLAEAVPALEILATNLEKSGDCHHAALVRLVEKQGKRGKAADAGNAASANRTVFA